MKNVLLIIDMQFDFCNPQGALYVPGAEKDIENTIAFIENTELDSIIFSQDNHHVIDISHPSFWENSEHKYPEPFTIIKYNDLENGLWRPKYHQKHASEYLKQLDEQGEFPHIIWPEHCIWGSFGASVDEKLMVAVNKWARQGKYFSIISKGVNPLTEHFGVLRANIPIAGDVSTQINKDLLHAVNEAENLYIAGEAKSHCVANTLKQLLEEDVHCTISMLENCMSNVPGFETLADPIYKNAIERGVKFINA